MSKNIVLALILITLFNYNQATGSEGKPVITVEPDGDKSKVTFTGDLKQALAFMKTLLQSGKASATAIEHATAATAYNCNTCGKPSAPHKCGRCQADYYCDKTCQGASWPDHKSTCVPPKE